MPEYYLSETFSNSGTRNEVRMRVVNKLSEESYGEGKGELASRYVYYVEALNNGDRVYLKRPAYLHNGFDFLICVENINFNPNGRRRDYPTHDDIIRDLSSKHSESQAEYDRLFTLIEQIYLCNDIDYSSVSTFTFSTGYSCELILKVLKWLFIEQDIRYWNYSGRDMLWSGLVDV